MAVRFPMVAITEQDIHDTLGAGDVLHDPASNLPYLTASTGGLRSYATLAAAVADASNLVISQTVIIQGGDNASTGFPNADAGIWQVTNAPVTVVGDFTKRLDVTDHASELFLQDTAGFYASTHVEGALQEIGSKQMVYRRGDSSLYGVTVSGATSTAFDAALKALILDNGSFVDVAGLGDTVTNGIVLNSTKAHKLPVRDAATNDSLTDGSGNEVYARLTQSGGNYVVAFYSDVGGTETAFSMPSTSIDLGYVWVSMDFMKLPALASINEADFFGDQAGVVGTIDDANIITNAPAFDGLLTGLGTQEAVNNRVDELGETANGKGASLIKIEDAAGNFTADNVEGALTELYDFIDNRQLVRHYSTLAAAQVAAALEQDWEINDIVVVTGPAPDDAERGIWKITSQTGTYIGEAAGDYTKIMDAVNTASEVPIVDAGGYYVATNVEAALQELATSVVATKTVFDYASVAAAVAAQVSDVHKIGDYVIISGTGLSDSESGIYEVTALTATAGNYTKILDKSNTAAEVAVADVGGNFTATNVEDALAEIAGLISNVNGVHDYDTLAAAQAASDATWLIGDYVIVAGTAVPAERGIWKIIANNTTTPGANAADYSKVLDISHTAAEVAIADAGGYFTGNSVEDALQELAASVAASQYTHTYATLAAAAADQGPADQKVGDIVVIAGTAPSESERGVYEVTAVTGVVGNYTKVLDISHTAAEVLIGNGSGASFTGTDVQDALDELLAAIGGTNTIVRDYSSNNYVTDNDSLVVAIGKLDQAIGALQSDKLVSTTYVAAEALTLTTGPKLVAATSTANNAELANASDTGTSVEIVGFATGPANLVASDPIPQVVSEGVLAGFTGLTPGAAYYANPSVEGGITATVPSVVGQWVVPVGVAKSATELLVRFGEPTEIVPASKAVQRNVWFRNTTGTANDGLGESGLAVSAGDVWIDNDETVQNPTKSGLGRYSVYVCKLDWTGTGAALTSGNINTYFQLIGKQN